MSNMNWNETLIRCSALYCLFTEPKSKEDKLAGRLSETAKTYLNKIYVEELWGKRREITTKQMEKGNLCEPEGIAIISMLDGVEYTKNEERKSDDYITGEADIVAEDCIHDIKCCWDAESFIPNLTDGINKADFYQAQGYMRLWNKPQARVRKCLISAPIEILKKELYYLFNKMGGTEESPEYIMAAADVNFNLTFDEIPIEHRVIDIIVERDAEIIAAIPSKVAKAREYLAELHEIHMSLNKKPQLI
jgi:hypothetical protein